MSDNLKIEVRTFTKYAVTLFFVNLWSIIAVLWGGYYCEMELGMEWVREPRDYTLVSLTITKTCLIIAWFVTHMDKRVDNSLKNI